MDPRSHLVLVGLSHRTTPVAVRERYVVRQADLDSTLAGLKALPNIEECFVLSTCNRTEVLAVGPKGLDIAGLVRGHVFRNLDEQHVYSYADVQALIHVFRVASGLDSLVLGESEVLAQIKRGMESAQKVGTLGPLLRPLLQQALHAGKRVRTETELGQGTLSVARVGLDIGARVFGDFKGVAALVVGAGETGQLVARHLRSLNVGRLAFSTRTPEKAQAIAQEVGAELFGLDKLGELMQRADLVAACVEADHPPIESRLFDHKALARRDRPLLVLDLSVPRAVAADVAKLHSNLFVHDLDDLQRAVRENEQHRTEAVQGTSEILVAEIHKYVTLRTYSAFTPVITDLRRRFEEIRESVLDSVAGARSDPKDVQLAHELSKRMLDAAMEHMKAGARSVRSEEVLDREYRRFLENL